VRKTALAGTKEKKSIVFLEGGKEAKTLGTSKKKPVRHSKKGNTRGGKDFSKTQILEGVTFEGDRALGKEV